MGSLGKKIRNAVIVAAASAAASGLVGMLVKKLAGGTSGAPVISAPGLTIGCRGGDQNVTQVTNLFYWIFWWISPPAAPEAVAKPSPGPDAARATPMVPESRPVDSNASSKRVPLGAEVVGRETKPLPGRAAKRVDEAEPAPPPSNLPSSDPDAPTVIRIGPRAPSPQTMAEEMREPVELRANIEAEASASASLSRVSATAQAGSLPVRHSPSAVVVEENCGTVQDGIYVPPPAPPQGFLLCTVRDETGSDVTTTTYRVPPEP